MKIAELVRVSGTPRSAIHHYRNLGLLPPPRIEGPKLHVYGPEHVARLREIRRHRARGLPLSKLVRHREDAQPIAPPTVRGGEPALRDAILEAAARLFVDRGFDAVTIADVARRAGVGKATFYRHFRGKTELFIDCLDRLRLTVIRPEERAAVAGLALGVESRLRAMAVLARFTPYRMMTNLLAQAAHGPDATVATRARQALHRMVTNAEPMLARAMQAGVFRTLDSELVAYMTWGALIAVGDRMQLDGRYSLDDAVRIYLDFVTFGIAARR